MIIKKFKEMANEKLKELGYTEEIHYKNDFCAEMNSMTTVTFIHLNNDDRGRLGINIDGNGKSNLTVYGIRGFSKEELKWLYAKMSILEEEYENAIK